MIFRRRKDPDLAWFEAEVGEHQRRLYGFAYYHLRDEDDAQDVVQETFVRLWSHRSRVQRETSAAWLTRVCRNACIDRLRKRKTRNEVSTEVDLLSNGETGADERMHRSDVHGRALALLDELDEPFRSLVILRDIQDLSYEEIATAMELPMTTVKVYLHRARKRLRMRLMSEVRDEVG